MICTIQTNDVRFPLPPGSGSDAVHRDPVYSYAVTLLTDENGITGTGLAFTLGAGNDLVCQVATSMARGLEGVEIEELMASFGAWQRNASNEQQLRWLGPHKGVVQLALASVTNACWDLWSKTRGVPLWQLLLDLTPAEVAATIDFSYLEDELIEKQAIDLMSSAASSRHERMSVLEQGYPGYDTSIGWFNYSDDQVRDNVRRAVGDGFTAMKLKVGHDDMNVDLRRVTLVREAAGASATLMVDCNQQWTIAQAIEFAARCQDLDLYWIEEPTHPDDILGHATIAHAIRPILVAAGEHLPNRVIFKNYLQAKAFDVCQVDAVRVAGVSEFLAVSLLCRKFGIPVVPHVGDMGQIHQHLVLFNHIALGHEKTTLEHIPHLQDKFLQPCKVREGKYCVPQEPGLSSNLIY